MVGALCSRTRGAVGAALVLILLTATTGTVLGGTPVHACPDPEEDPVVATDHRVEAHDGIELAVTLWYNTTRTHEELPVILGGHGWAGNRGDLEDRARLLVDHGYVVLAWDSRGFGESGGSVGLNGPDEWADVSTLIDWVAQEDLCPGVQLDAPDNPRLGMIGRSYGGAIQLLASAHDERIDAIVPDIAWNDLVQSLAPETIVKRGWVDLLYFGGEAASHGLMSTPPNPNTGGMDDRLTGWYLEATLTGSLPEDAMEPLMDRSPVTHLHNVKAHTLLTQGYNDTLFLPDEALASYEALAQRPDAQTHLLFHPKGHGHSMSDATRDAFKQIVVQFYEHHLKDPTNEPLAPVTYWDPQLKAFTSADTWPPEHTDSNPIALATGDDSQTVTLVQLPVPTSHTEWQQFSGEYHQAFGPWLPEHLDLTGATSLQLQTRSDNDGPLSLLGRPSVSFGVTPHVDRANLFVSLVDTSGPGNVIYNQVTPLLLEGHNGQRIDLELPLSSLAYTLGGDELELRITTSDTGFHGSREPGTIDIHLEDAVLHLPGPV